MECNVNFGVCLVFPLRDRKYKRMPSTLQRPPIHPPVYLPVGSSWFKARRGLSTGAGVASAGVVAGRPPPIHAEGSIGRMPPSGY